MQSKKEMPLEHKPILTIREASFYTGISEEKLIRLPVCLVDRQSQIYQEKSFREIYSDIGI